MASVNTEKVDTGHEDGIVNVYATKDGFVQLVSEHDGIKRTLQFTPEEWNAIAIGGIQLGVVAKQFADDLATEKKGKVEELAPRLTEIMRGRANGKKR